MADPVVIVDYDPSWPGTFGQLRDRLAAALGPLAVAIEHVGSTAVPGLAAKPIIDLDVVIAGRGDLPAVVRRLRLLGYRHEGDLGVPGREAFASPAGAPPHHLYVCAVGASALDRHLAFRDALRADSALADAYGDLKRALAARLAHDRNAYTEAKSAFVERVLAPDRLRLTGPDARRPEAPISVRLLHLGVLVRDQGRSLRFYEAYFGFDQAGARRYPDGTVIVRNADGFDLALHPGDPPEQLPAFLHFGFQLPDADAVRGLLARMEAEGVPILERWDEPGYVAFKCLDPDRWRVEVYWEPVGRPAAGP